MLVAVVGPRGNLGRLLIEQGLQRGFTFRAISPHMPTSTDDPRVRGVAASDRDNDALVEAFSGCDVVVVVFRRA